MDKKELQMLQKLANRWVMEAREYLREAKISGTDERTTAFERGRAEAMNKAAQDLAAVLKQLMKEASLIGQPISSGEELMPASAPGAPEVYAEVPINEVLQFLEFAGTTARDVRIHKDNAITAVFSRWQPLSTTERLQRIRDADPTIIILDEGKLQDTGDPYVDFAFRVRK